MFLETKAGAVPLRTRRRSLELVCAEKSMEWPSMQMNLFACTFLYFLISDSFLTAS